MPSASVPHLTFRDRFAVCFQEAPMTRLQKLARTLFRQETGSVFVEYLLLVTLVGLGVMVGLTTLRVALINELQDLADAIQAITL